MLFFNGINCQRSTFFKTSHCIELVTTASILFLHFQKCHQYIDSIQAILLAMLFVKLILNRFYKTQMAFDTGNFYYLLSFASGTHVNVGNNSLEMLYGKTWNRKEAY